MTVTLPSKGLLAALALVASATAAQADSPCCPTPCGSPCDNIVLCRAPLTKSYRIAQGFCPQQLVGLIQNCAGLSWADCCGPYGIPPVYASGDFVLVRQSTDGHERVAKFLTGLGVYTAPKIQ
jgi:hypothetical protein